MGNTEQGLPRTDRGGSSSTAANPGDRRWCKAAAPFRRTPGDGSRWRRRGLARGNSRRGRFCSGRTPSDESTTTGGGHGVGSEGLAAQDGGGVWLRRRRTGLAGSSMRGFIGRDCSSPGRACLRLEVAAACLPWTPAGRWAPAGSDGRRAGRRPMRCRPGSGLRARPS
jgi:hypothetical protein